MPVNPEVAHLYRGPRWEAIRRRILRRADERCECLGECGKHGGLREGYRCNRADRSDYRNPEGHLVRVILTIAHLNHRSGDDRDENLRAFCQQCHVNYDSEQHKRNAAVTRRAKLHNLELFAWT